MKGKLTLFYYIKDMGTVLPLRVYIAIYLLSKGFPLTLTAWIGGFKNTEELGSLLLQLNQVQQVMAASKGEGTPLKADGGVEPIEADADAVQPGSLRERFIEYLRENSDQ